MQINIFQMPSWCEKHFTVGPQGGYYSCLVLNHFGLGLYVTCTAVISPVTGEILDRLLLKVVILQLCFKT